MSQIIEGLHVDVSSTELKLLLLGRLKYHEDKAGFYEKQLVEMKKLDQVMAEEAAQIGKTSNRSPAESIDGAIKNHKDQAIFYKFVAEHVIEGATYRLDEQDLQRIGVMHQRY
jgi:hypothetical protein